MVPILGLLLAAALFFVLGGIGMFRQSIELVTYYVGGLTHTSSGVDQDQVIFEVVEFVHLFLVGTVLYITAVGFYQLFIRELKLPRWLKIASTEELETNLIGVTVVVLAVNFMGAVFVGEREFLLQHGAGIALPIAALALFVGLRAWSVKIGKEIAVEEGGQHSQAEAPDSTLHDAGEKATVGDEG